MYQSLLSGHLPIGILTHTYTLDILLLLSYDISMYLVHRMCSGISNSDNYENHKIVRGYGIPFYLHFLCCSWFRNVKEAFPPKKTNLYRLPIHVYDMFKSLFISLKTLRSFQFVDCRCCLNFIIKAVPSTRCTSHSAKDQPLHRQDTATAPHRRLSGDRGHGGFQPKRRPNNGTGGGTLA